MRILDLTLLLVLSIVIYEDLRYREIHLSLFLLLLIMSIVQGYLVLPHYLYVKSCCTNLLFITVQISMLLGYCLLKEKRLRNIFGTSIGIGDVVLFIIAGFAFSTINFITFYLIGLIFSLVSWVIYKLIFSTKNKLIPLAGLISLFMILVIIGDAFSTQFERYSDNYLIQLIYG